ncbi:MAG TPA: hypothetical protein VFF30_06885 [Nitrososphaerales archaeon]|nr:hypothetical protein [Nitrososphaerales archaeon]
MIRSAEEREKKEYAILELDLFIRRSPESVRTWWIDLPDDYEAKDPSEQPYRIITTKHNANGGRELLTFWRNPDGSDWLAEETMHLFEDGLSWAFDVKNPRGFLIRDDFHAVPVEGGTRLEIRSKITPRKPEAETMISQQKEQMTQLWKKMVAICERDAPSLP